ncbi:MAG: hypothetical protein U1F43_29320 [Myxococcota bacterium]
MAQQQGSSLRATIRALVASGVAAHGVEPELHRVFEDEMPRIRGSARGASVDDPTLGARQAFMAASRYQWDDEERVSWVVRTAAHAVIHRAVSERPADPASGALTEELVTLIEKYPLARRRK